jgi:predicted ester cyclase
VIGPEGFYPFFDRMQATLSDVRVTVHDTIQEDDRLCVRWTCTARHTGGGLGTPPSGNAVRVTGITIHRVAGARIVEAWQNWDMLGLLEQLRAGEAAQAPTYVAAR